MVTGEGLIGLPFALFVAGDVNTVLTLLPVDDVAPAESGESALRKLKVRQAATQVSMATNREFIGHKQYSNPALLGSLHPCRRTVKSASTGRDTASGATNQMGMDMFRAVQTMKKFAILLRLLGVVAACLGPCGAATLSMEPMLRIEAGMHTAAIQRISADATGRWAVTASQDKTVRVWEVESGRLLAVLRPPIGPLLGGQMRAVAMSPDGATVAASGYTATDTATGHSVFLFDRVTYKLKSVLVGGLPQPVQGLAFNPDGTKLAATTLRQGGLRVYNLRAGMGPWVDESYANDTYGVGWSRDGRLATASYDGKLRVYQPSDFSGTTAIRPSVEVQAPGGMRPYSLAFSPDGERIAVGYDDTNRVDVLNSRTLDLQYSPEVGGKRSHCLCTVAWSRDGQTLAASGRWEVNDRYVVRTWQDAGRGLARDTPVASNSIYGLLSLPGGAWLVGAMSPEWGVLAVDGEWRPRGAMPIADMVVSRGDAFRVDSAGQVVQFGFERGGKAAYTFDLRQRRLSSGAMAAGIAALTTGIHVTDWANGRAPKLNGFPIVLQQSEISRSLAIEPGGLGFALGTDFRLRYFDASGTQLWSKVTPSTARGVNIPPSGKVVVVAYGDGTIRWHRLTDGQEVLAFFPHADRKRWVLWTPSGYYDASSGAEELIGWHVNRAADQTADFFPVARFRDRFYRPDIIDRVLDTLDEGVAAAQANGARGMKVQLAPAVARTLPPVLELVSEPELQAREPVVTVRVRSRTSDDSPVMDWRVRVDGQNVAEDKNTSSASTAGTGERELKVPVPARDSEIQIFAENRHGVSTPATVKVSWAGAAPEAPGFQIQPKLYVLAIGVAHYQHKDIPKLDLAAKDARDFAAAMLVQQGKLYRQVEVKLLTDEKATRDEIVDGLDWLLRQATQHDVGMVFIAGHGVNDGAQGYTFLPVNADPDRLRRSGVSMEEFRKTLANLPGKALFFFDTCHSGNVLGTRSRAAFNDVSGVINELTSAENGVVVFSSSTGRQLSHEDPAWGNGAFTKAVVEGIKGAADYQRNGRVTHKMLDLYVSERVKDLTQGKQSPVTQAPGGVPDFPVAIVGTNRG